MFGQFLYHVALQGEHGDETIGERQRRLQREEENAVNNNDDGMQQRRQGTSTTTQMMTPGRGGPPRTLEEQQQLIEQQRREAAAEKFANRRIRNAPPPSSWAVCSILGTIFIVVLLPFIALPLMVAARRRTFEAAVAPPVAPWPVNIKAPEYFVNTPSLSKQEQRSFSRKTAIPGRFKGMMGNNENNKGEYRDFIDEHVAVVVALRGIGGSNDHHQHRNNKVAVDNEGLDHNLDVSALPVHLPIALTSALAQSPKHLPLQIIFSLSAVASQVFDGKQSNFHEALRQTIMLTALSDNAADKIHSALHKEKYTVLFSGSNLESAAAVESLSSLYNRGLDSVSPSAGTVLFLSDSTMPIEPATFVFRMVSEFHALRHRKQKNQQQDEEEENEHQQQHLPRIANIAALQCSQVHHDAIVSDSLQSITRYTQHARNLSKMNPQQRHRRATTTNNNVVLQEMWTDPELRVVDSGWKIGVGTPPGRDHDSLRGVALFGTWHGFNLRAAGFHPPPHSSSADNDDGDDDEGDHDDRLPFLVDAVGSNCIIVDRAALHEAGAFAATQEFPSDVDQVAAGAGWKLASLRLAELFVFDMAATFLDLVNTYMSNPAARITVPKRRALRGCVAGSVEAVTRLEESSGLTASAQHMRWAGERPWRAHYSSAVREALHGCDRCPHQRGERFCPVVDEALCYCELLKAATANLENSVDADKKGGGGGSGNKEEQERQELLAKLAGQVQQQQQQAHGKTRSSKVSAPSWSSSASIPDAAAGWSFSLRLRAAAGGLRVASSRTAPGVVSLMSEKTWAALFMKAVLPPSAQLLTIAHGTLFTVEWCKFARTLFPEFARMLAAHRHSQSWGLAPQVAWSHRTAMLAMWGRRRHSALSARWGSNESLNFDSTSNNRPVASSSSMLSYQPELRQELEQEQQRLHSSSSSSSAAATSTDLVSWSPSDLDKMPFIHVVWFAICCGCCGFSSEIAHFTRPLSELYPVSLLLGPDCFCPGYESGFADVLGRAHLRPHKYQKFELYPGEVMVWISHTDPLSYQRNEYFHRRHPNFVIGRSMYEFTRIPKEWDHAILRNADEIWAPSQFVVRCFVDAGVPMSKIRVVPEGVDTNFFAPHVHKPLRLTKFDDVPSQEFHERNGVTWMNYQCNRPPMSRQKNSNKNAIVDDDDDDDDEFIFFSQFKWEPRKGWRENFEAYFRAFYNHTTSSDDKSKIKTNNNNVALVVLTINFYMEASTKIGDIHNASMPFDDIAKLVSEMWPVNTPKLADLPRFCILADQVSEREMAGLFRGADAFVLPTRGEGWGLPTMQAMSMALPVISTNWGGSVDFTTPDTTFLIEIESVDEVPRNSPYGWRPGKKWAKPSVKHLTELFRYLFTEREHAREVGQRARQHIVRHFDDFEVVRIVDRRLQEIAFQERNKHFWN